MKQRKATAQTIASQEGVSMRLIARTAMAVLATAALAGPAAAQVATGFSNPKIVLLERPDDAGKGDGNGAYWMWSLGDASQTDPAKQKPQPLSAERVKIRADMKQRRVLEEYAEFLSPLRLPRTLRVIASDCAGNSWDSPYYSFDRRWMNMCYSFASDAAQKAHLLAQYQDKLHLPIPVAENQLVAGMFAATVLHETGHALFDLLDAPVFGREEDAADQMAAFVAVQFNKEIARTVIKGFAYYWYLEAFLKADPGALDPKDPDYPKDLKGQCLVDAFCGYEDMHGTASQRMYNTLCIAYGGNHAAFQDLVDNKWLPAARAKNCNTEYNQAYLAFSKTVYPFIDQAQMKKVQSRQDWFMPAEMKEK
jgi:Putative metallopeptidase